MFDGTYGVQSSEYFEYPSKQRDTNYIIYMYIILYKHYYYIIYIILCIYTSE